jgi:hypothetical protein
MQGDRTRLAREAVRGRWSVRELEQRARRANAPGSGRFTPRRRAVALHPDQEDAVAQIADSFAVALGQDVDVSATATGGYRVHVGFDSLDEALDLASRLRR